jgi:hypothetical protein
LSTVELKRDRCQRIRLSGKRLTEIEADEKARLAWLLASFVVWKN